MARYRNEDCWTEFEETLRQAIEDSGLSLNQIQKETGVRRSALALFVKRESGMTSWSCGKLMGFFRMTLLVPKTLQGMSGAPLIQNRPTVRHAPPVIEKAVLKPARKKPVARGSVAKKTEKI